MPRARARLAMIVLVACGAAAPIAARADEPAPRAHLIYVREPGAERCPDEPNVRAAVAARLGYNPFSLQAPRTVTVVVRGEPPGLLAKIEMSDALGDVNGNRRLTSPRLDCEELASALALAVALAIDPLSALHDPPPAPPPPAPAEGGGEVPSFVPPPVEPAVIPVPIKPPPPANTVEPTRVRAGLGALLSLGTAPSIASAGFALQVGFRQAGWSLGLEARGDLPGGAADGDGRIYAWLVAGWLVPCLHFPIRPMGKRVLEAAGCALLGAGVDYGRGEGMVKDYPTVDAPYVAGGLRAALEVPVGERFALGVHADLVAPILYLRLQLEDEPMTTRRTEWLAPPISGAVSAMLFYYFR